MSDAPEPMDEQEEQEGLERVTLPELPPIDSSRILLAPNGNGARWIERDAKREPLVYARTMQAMASNGELQQDLCGKVAVQWLWPMAVHVSPLYLLLGRADAAYKPRLVSSYDVATWLNQLLLYYTQVHVQVAVSTTEPGVECTEVERIRQLDTRHAAMYSVLDEHLHLQLADQVYLAQVANEDERLAAFERCMVQFTHDYLHLLEYTLWCMADAEEIVPLAQVLTPTTRSSERVPTPQEHAALLRVFRIKTLALNAQLERHGCKHETRDWFPDADLDAMSGWIDATIARHYMHYMDSDGLLQ